MPTYEYKCQNCGHRFDIFRPVASSAAEEPETDCPVCGKPAKRLISAGAGLIFKGSGFYITDHRSAEYKKKAAADK
jgi:putative FmdB family regulatory protein